MSKQQTEMDTISRYGMLKRFDIGEKLANKIGHELTPAKWVGKSPYFKVAEVETWLNSRSIDRMPECAPAGHCCLTELRRHLKINNLTMARYAQQPGFPAPAGRYKNRSNYRTVAYYNIDACKHWLNNEADDEHDFIPVHGDETFWPIPAPMSSPVNHAINQMHKILSGAIA